jgi:5-methylcytosine-specific restriction endonuclease McrA
MRKNLKEFILIRATIRKRDNHICQICSKTEKENGQELDVHHIDYDKQNNNPNNLISLCMSYHRKTNNNRKYWLIHLSNILKKRSFLCILP